MTMIEKVARALCLSKRNGEYPPGVLERKIDEQWHLFVADATVAITAMREPTDEMISAKDERGDPVIWDCNCHYCGGPKDNWNVMIDAALKVKLS